MASPGRKRKRILYVEDNEDAREVAAFNFFVSGLLKRGVDHFQLTAFTAVPLVDLRAAHEADPVRRGEFRPMLRGVPPQGFDLGLLSSDQKFQVFLLERLDRAQGQSPHQEERLRIAYAVRFQPGERSGQINRDVIDRNLGVRVQNLPDVVVAEDFRRVTVEPVAQLFNFVGRDSESGGHRVAAVFDQRVRNGVEGLDQMEPLDRTRAAVRDPLFVYRADQGGTPGQIDYFRTGYADHASMKPFALGAGEDQHAVEFRLPV